MTDTTRPDLDAVDLAGATIDLTGPEPVVTGPERTVAFVDLRAEMAEHGAEIGAAVQGVLDRCDFVLGGATAELERAFADYCGTAHAIGLDSGFSALELIMRAVDIGPGDEVITSANTFYSTVRAIEACGATPVLVDADHVVRNMDPKQLAAAITPATKAILPVHLYGHPADMDSIRAIAAEHDLYVFEDACQAHGAYYRGVRAGGLSDAAAFSFYPSKNMGALGDAGIVTTDNPEIDERIRSMRNLGSQVKYVHEGPGFNRRLDTIHAAALNVKLPHLDAANERRREAAHWYLQALEGLDVKLPETASWADPVYHLFVVELDGRERVGELLNSVGVQTGIHYPFPIHLIPAFSGLGYRAGDFPVSERLGERILSLPMHPYLTEGDVAYVAEALAAALAAR